MINGIEEKQFATIEGGVCAAKGIKANGLNCGLNKDKNKNDLGLVVSDVMCNAAAVYTTTKVKGAPILVTKAHLAACGGRTRGFIANSKNANTCNADGVEKAEAMCQLAAKALGIQPEEIVVASTGVIAQILPIEPIAEHVEELAAGLSYEGNQKAANAIMTTDTVMKEIAVEFELDGKSCRMGGMAKGSGMIHPNMATTLNFITTDAAVGSELLQKALSDVVKVTYNCLSVDGDTSTNDTVLLMANGLAGNPEVTSESEEYKIFKSALYFVMMNLTRMLAKDGEGASKLIECTCAGAPDLDTAITVARSVVRSPLVKSAMFGRDANCGRIFCAIGYAEADFDIDRMEVAMSSENGRVEVYRDGAGIEFSEEKAEEILSADEIFIHIDLHQGDAYAKAWGCDLTYDYVRINGDYRT